MSKKSFLVFVSFVAALLLLHGRACHAEVCSIEAKPEALLQHVIVNRPAHTESLTLNELRAIFSLRARVWPDGSKITVVSLNDQNPVHRAFLLNTLKMLPHQLRRQWDRYIYSGIGHGPVVVDTMDEMVKTVNSTPGSIGYIEGGVPCERVATLAIR
ncbi:MAG: hypothetical protein CSA50_06870 [Gammaproteobacteria bacterium]|nr:MAG: hypothetical protein CSA50_06870 [Gammaproteobacteria bacterium]